MNYKTLNYPTLKAALSKLKTPEERARLLRAAGWTEEEFKMDSLLEQADTGEINSGDALAQMFHVNRAETIPPQAELVGAYEFAPLEQIWVPIIEPAVA
jgi:hypothetical protein